MTQQFVRPGYIAQPEETLQARVGRILCLRSKAEFEVKQDGPEKEAWAHVLTLLEFVEQLGSCYSTATEFVSLTKNYLLHEHNRLLKSSGKLIAGEGTYEEAVQKWSTAKNILLGISDVPTAHVKNKYEVLMKQYNEAQNVSSARKAELEVLRRQFDESETQKLRKALAEAQGEVHCMEYELEESKKSVKKLHEQVAEMKATEREEDFERREEDAEKIAELEEKLQILKKRLTVQRGMYEGIISEQGRLIARSSISTTAKKRVKR